MFYCQMGIGHYRIYPAVSLDTPQNLCYNGHSEQELCSTPRHTGTDSVMRFNASVTQLPESRTYHPVDASSNLAGGFYDLGVQAAATYQVKRIDSDFFSDDV